MFPSELLWTPGEKRGVYFWCVKLWVHANKQKKVHCAGAGWETHWRKASTYWTWHCPFSHLSIQQCHGDVAINVAPPGAQSGELHGGRRWEGRWQRRRLRGKLKLVAATEMPHLRCTSERQRHLVVVWDLCRQSNLYRTNKRLLLHRELVSFMEVSIVFYIQPWKHTPLPHHQLYLHTVTLLR